MKYLTLDHIRQHLRIDQTGEEDAVLDLYGSAAEDTVLNVLNRTIDDVIETYGGIPDPIRQATLLLTGQSYMHREPASTQNLALVPYTFDLLLKPYIRLADKTDGEHRSHTVRYVTVGSEVMIDLGEGMPTGISPQGISFTVTVYNATAIDKKVVYQKEDCIISQEGSGVSVVVDTESLGVGQMLARISMQVPDETFPKGSRKEVRKVNPYIIVIG